MGLEGQVFDFLALRQSFAPMRRYRTSAGDRAGKLTGNRRNRIDQEQRIAR
jgi:hypothetical protein